MYKRVLIKLSGEALSGKDCVLSGEFLEKVASQIRICVENGVEVAIVIGGGNIWRGARQKEINVERVRADHMGMLATLINCIGMSDYLIKAGLKAKVMSAVPMEQFCEVYNQSKAREYLSNGYVVLCSCGVGYPYFSTDTGMMLRAAELEVDVVLSAKSIDGVYSDDPKTNPNAIKYDKITYDEMIEKNLKAIDQTAASLGRDNGIKVLLFSLAECKNIVKAVNGENIGTLIE